MAKKVKEVKEVKEKVQLNLENVIVGTSIKDLHGEDVKIDEDLIAQMKVFEKESKQHAIWKGKLTGSFLYFKWMKENPQEMKTKKKPGRKPKKVEEDDIEELIEAEELEEIDEVIEEEAVDEENLMLDAMEDYRMKFNVKTVNTNTKKFKAFFEEWKKVE